MAALAVLVLLGGGLLFVRNWSAERELRQAVEPTVTFGLWSSSTTRPGGEVRFFVLVRNEWVQTVAVTSVDTADAGLRLRMRDDGERPIVPGQETEVPLSVRLSCVPGAGARDALVAELGVRREDGGSTSRPADLRPASLVPGPGGDALCRSSRAAGLRAVGTGPAGPGRSLTGSPPPSPVTAG